jgi:hypothetical protein
MNERHEGGCYCGYIRFAIEGDIETAGLCHCDNCRKATGGHVVAWVMARKDRFSITSGELTRYQTDTKAWRGFCPKCGTSVTYESTKRLDQIDITTGSMDHPENFPPQWDAFEEERLPWVERVKKES